MDVREKLVELIFDSLCRHIDKSCKLAENIADDLINNGVTVQQWIPVSSPPKKPGAYLCYFKYEPESPNIICQNTYFGSGRWMSEPDRVIHWSYLPRPPKGEKP